MSKRMTETQIVSILKEADAGLPAKKLCRKYGGMEASDVKHLKELEEATCAEDFWGRDATQSVMAELNNARNIVII